MHRQFESLSKDNDFIILNNIVFNANQIKDSIIQDFKPEKNNLNFCRKNIFLKKYFREINNQGIFNRIEWKFWLKSDVQCELIAFDLTRQIDELQIRVILEFPPLEKGYNTLQLVSSQDNYNSQYFNLKVLLDFSLQDLELEETPVIDSVEIIAFKNIYEQKIAYFYSHSSEKICI
ncbi:MAG: hypothetical protein AAF915_20595 [Cyanobacteria bacterium P01_D01_bin.50]